jgi:hypothetical protein
MKLSHDLLCHSLDINSWRIKAGTKNPMITNYSSTYSSNDVNMLQTFLHTYLFNVRVSWIKGFPVLQI